MRAPGPCRWFVCTPSIIYPQQLKNYIDGGIKILCNMIYRREVQIMDKSTIDKISEVLRNSKYAIASTGAGVSAESGISTFRDDGGIWDRIDVTSVATPSALLKTLEENADDLIPYFKEVLFSFLKAAPNPGHDALFKLEAKGILKMIITQNGDNLHAEMGSKNIIELHGNFFRMKCLACSFSEQLDRKIFSANIISSLDQLSEYAIENLLSLVPRCAECGSLMRPDVVMFTEEIKDADKAFGEAAQCDVILVLGTSGSVYPASYLPVEAKRHGATVVVINPNEDSYSNISDMYLPLKTGEALPQILSCI